MISVIVIAVAAAIISVGVIAVVNVIRRGNFFVRVRYRDAASAIESEGPEAAAFTIESKGPDVPIFPDLKKLRSLSNLMGNQTSKGKNEKVEFSSFRNH